MTVSYGFYNSLNHDRLYDALDFSRIFDGIIRDGVFATVGNAFRISAAGTDRTIQIDTGRAWFNGTWTYNDGIISLQAPESNILYPRIDALVLEVDTNTRVNEFKFIEGNAQTNPQRPTLEQTNTKHQYPFAYITRAANSTIVRNADISSQIGTANVPFVTGILSVISMESLIGKWRDELDKFVEDETADFLDWYQRMDQAFQQWNTNKHNEIDDWFSEHETSMENWIEYNQHDFLDWYDRMKDQLTQDAAGNLQTQVDLATAIAEGTASNVVTFNSDGSITEDGDKGIVQVIFNADGSITETRTRDGHTKRKTITFNGDVIREEVIIL